MSNQPPPVERSLPRLTKLGLAIVGSGLLFDLSEHGFVSHANDATVAGFPLAEHAAHLVVLVGMLAVLIGIVIDGVRISRGRFDRPERSRAHALR
jgi:hypothetical protein